MLQVFGERRAQAIREHGQAVFETFAIPHHDLLLIEIEVFDSQADAFHQSQPAAVEQFSHQLVGAGHAGEQSVHFILGEDGGQAFWAPGAHGADGKLELLFEDLAVEVEDSTEGLVLGSSGDVSLDRQVGEESFDLRSSHIDGVSFVVEEDEAFDPIEVGPFGAQ
jgi:hypothetical protein